MDKKIITKQSLGAWFAAIKSSGQRLLGPVEKNGQTTYDEIASPADRTSAELQIRHPSDNILCCGDITS